MTSMTVFESEKVSNDIVINDTMSYDEVVASDVPPRYLFLVSLNEVPPAPVLVITSIKH